MLCKLVAVVGYPGSRHPILGPEDIFNNSTIHENPRGCSPDCNDQPFVVQPQAKEPRPTHSIGARMCADLADGAADDFLRSKNLRPKIDQLTERPPRRWVAADR